MFLSNYSVLQEKFSVLPDAVLLDRTPSNFRMLHHFAENRTEKLKVCNIKMLGEGDILLTEIGFRRWVELKNIYLNPAPQVYPGRVLSE